MMKREVEDNLKRPITSWFEDDRPREKMLGNGRQAMSTAELIAILLGSGSREESAVDLARRILHHCDNDLNKLARLGVRDLCAFKGVGKAKAVSLIAAMEIGSRRPDHGSVPDKITTSAHAFGAIKNNLCDLNHEEFWVIALNRSNSIMEKYLVSRGGVSGTVADIKLIFKPAIQLLASAIIVCHNHPSGNLKPSKADQLLTDKVKKSGDILDIAVLDHIIIADNNYFSFADEGLI